MGTGRTDEFRKDAVRIALTSGLSRRQVADDLGVGMSRLNKWVTAHRDTDVVLTEDRELARENERLRREIHILKDLSRIRKQSGGLFSRRMWDIPKEATKPRSPGAASSSPRSSQTELAATDGTAMGRLLDRVAA